MFIAEAPGDNRDFNVRVALDNAHFVARISMFPDRHSNRDTLLATRAVRSINIASGATKTVLNQLVIGSHVHVHMGIGKRANRLAVIQVTAGLGSGSKKVEFYLIVHASLTVDSIYLV